MLTITKTPLAGLLTAAEQAGSSECMGLLFAERRGDNLVTAACLIPAEASGSHAEAEPIAVRNAVAEYETRGKRPIGIWHSHGNFGVFHSATDDKTTNRVLPAMAEWGFRSPAASLGVPMVTRADSAVAPLYDGRWLQIDLLGSRIPGSEHMNEVVEWQGIYHRFSSDFGAARMTREDALVRLSAGGVELGLGIPDGASVAVSTEERGSVRVAKLFSLVVNRRGEQYAEEVSVYDLNGQAFLTKQSCDITVVKDKGQGVGDGRARTVDVANLCRAATASLAKGIRFVKRPEVQA